MFRNVPRVLAFGVCICGVGGVILDEYRSQFFQILIAFSIIYFITLIYKIIKMEKASRDSGPDEFRRFQVFTVLTILVLTLSTISLLVNSRIETEVEIENRFFWPMEVIGRTILVNCYMYTMAWIYSPVYILS
jgi:hypothetical protein